MNDMREEVLALKGELANHRKVQPNKQSAAHNKAAASYDVSLTAAQNDGTGISGQDVLVRHGANKQYINEILLSKVIEEVEEEESSQSCLATPSVQQDHGLKSPYDPMGLLSVKNESSPPSVYHPTRSMAMRLWNSYTHNFEPCMVTRVLHMPSTELKVYTTIDDPSAASYDTLALCFAIYYAATIALDGSEILTTLHSLDRRSLLQKFKTGLEQALAYSDFLEHPSLTCLQAVAVYLTALRTYNRGKALLHLNGLLIRLCQSLGLHRPGESLGLSPFESEIRRRVWWHFAMVDISRAGEDWGIDSQNGRVACGLTEVGLPLNVDDVALYPEMKNLPEGRTDFTAMTFSLRKIELDRAMHRLSAAAAAASTLSSSVSDSLEPREERRVQIMNELRLVMDSHLKPTNPIVPIQRLTLQCSEFLLRKLDFTTRQRWFFLRCRNAQAATTDAAKRPRNRSSAERLPQTSDFATDSNLLEAIEILGPRLTPADEMLQQWSWQRRAYPQLHIPMYILWHLCVKPDALHAETAWKAVETIFHSELRDESGQYVPGISMNVLVALRSRALALRASRGLAPVASGDVSVQGLPFQQNLPAASTVNMPDVGMGWDPASTDDWAIWETMLQGFDGEMTRDTLWT